MNTLAAGIDLHNNLNPLLWDDFRLRPDVREGLLKIAKKFYQFVQVPAAVHDVIVTGSQTSYTYTDYSDLDLHIIVEYGSVACDQPVDELFRTKRDLWRDRHTITVKGVPVECYVEDLDQPVTGSSYSLLKNTWVNKPSRPDNIDEDDLDRVAQAWIIVITQALRLGELAALEHARDLLKDYRRVGLRQQGELGRANLVFKSLRNTGVVDLLTRAIRTLQDRELSVPN
jgi:hypothetical protein